MATKANGPIQRLLHRRALARWARAALGAPNADLSTLRAQRQQARQLRVPLTELTQIADSRLALPRVGSDTFTRPPGTMWSWRPKAWRVPLERKGYAALQNKTRLGDQIRVFHDCNVAEMTVLQQRNARENDLAAFGLRLEVFHFDGSFLSLAINLPGDAMHDLKRSHLFRLNAMLEIERSITVLARLNIKHGPNTEQIIRDIPIDQKDVEVEFDLAYAQLNEQRIEGMWLDLIFEHPGMNQITVRDLTLCRHPRAEL